MMRMLCSIFTALALPALVLGCATVKSTDPYAGTGVAMRPSTPSAAIEHDGQAPRAATPPADQPLDRPLKLDECIALALQNNPELAASRWDSEAAQAETRVQSGDRWPSVRLTGSYFHYQDEQRLVQPSSPGDATYFTDNLLNADLNLKFPLYAGGRILNEIRAAELLARSAEHTVARTREELVFNVSSTYFGILAQRHVIESLEFSRDALRQHRDRVEQLVDAQKAAKVDALRTGVRVADLEQQLLRERNVLEISQRFLANLLGVESVSPTGLVLADPLTLVEMTPMLDNALALAYRQRHDYAAAAAALEAQAKRVDIARGERAPEVALEASYGGRWGIGGAGDPVTPSSDSLMLTQSPEGVLGFQGSTTRPLGAGNSFTTTRSDTGANSLRFTPSTAEAADDFEDVGRIGVTVEVPLFEGGRLRARIAKERARLNAAQQRLRKLELQIQLEVETALLNANSARARVNVSEKSIAEAEESLRIERAKYDFGKGAVVDVFDAQAALLQAQTSYYRALADLNIATAQARLAIGDDTP